MVLCGAITDNIVQMPVGVYIRKGFQIFQNGNKIPFIDSGFVPPLKKIRVIGVLPIYQVGGADTVIEGILPDILFVKVT